MMFTALGSPTLTDREQVFDQLDLLIQNHMSGYQQSSHNLYN